MLFHLEQKKPLVDVRSPGEYSGQLLHMPEYPQEGAQRGGHIPGAKNVPWARAANPDGSWPSANPNYGNVKRYQDPMSVRLGMVVDF